MHDQIGSDQEYRPQKRKSNFDVPPENLVDNNSLSQAIEKLTSISAVNIETWIPVTDKTMTARLEKAIQKNFDYLDEKDNNPELFELKKSTRAKSSIKNEAVEVIQNRTVLQTMPTIGLVQAPVEEQPRENSRVYISGLPLDFTDEDIDILFSCQGKIKRIKFYLDNDGNKKGDCLVTYVKSESAVMAVSKLNSLDIGDGHVISVAAADFKKAEDNSLDLDTVIDNPSQKIAKSNNNSLLNIHQALHQLETSDSPVIDEYEFGGCLSSLRSLLPMKLECDKFAVMLIRNAYDYSKVVIRDVSYLRDIEADLLIECCQFGEVKSVTTPSEGDSRVLFGSILVSFTDMDSALNCAKSLHNRWYDKKQLKILLFLPFVMSQSFTETKESEDVQVVGNETEAQNFDLDNFFNTLL